MKLNRITLAIVVVAVCLFLFRAFELPWTWWRIAGMALFVPAFALFLVARWQLGAAFSVRARATTLVTTGLYSRIRNPIYVFGALMIAAIILWSGQFWLFALLIPLIAMQIVRSRKEARVLEERFGEEYRAWRARTWF